MSYANEFEGGFDSYMAERQAEIDAINIEYAEEAYIIEQARGVEDA